MQSFYNEINPYAAQWIRNLSEADEISPGFVEEKSIINVSLSDLKNYSQAHFFAGIGVWSRALREAGVEDDFPLWTGSCPCQPFSVAGKGRGFSDSRHLWPNWFDLIKQCKPPIIFGEQVASPDGLNWLDTVQTDLEKESYSFAAADLCAAGIGAPHLRQRLFFMAYRVDERFAWVYPHLYKWRSLQDRAKASRSSENMQPRSLASTDGENALGQLANNNNNAGSQGWIERWNSEYKWLAWPSGLAGSGFWDDSEWIPCRDGKARQVEPGSFPLVNGTPTSLGKARAKMIHGYGNVIVRPLATEFIISSLETITDGWTIA